MTINTDSYAAPTKSAFTVVLNDHVIDVDTFGDPVIVSRVVGVRCGGDHSARTYHANVEAVRYCHRITQAQLTQMEAEAAAERAYERHLEDRGWWDALQDSYRESGLI